MTNGLALEADRVRANTSPAVNREIDAKTLSNIRRYASQPRAAVERRISELNREWDIERVLEANAGVLAAVGAVLGASVSRKWLVLTGTVLAFLLLHATEGWCPPVPLLRGMGIRTRSEIDREKLALKYMRGDFGNHSHPPREVRRLGALVG